MEGVKKEIRLLWQLLQNKDKWYLEVQHPDTDLYTEIADEAKTYATEKLSKMSVNALYQRYRTWFDNDPILSDVDEYYHAFLSEVAWHLCLEGLPKGDEKLYFEESCSVEIKFL